MNSRYQELINILEKRVDFVSSVNSTDTKVQDEVAMASTIPVSVGPKKTENTLLSTVGITTSMPALSIPKPTTLPVIKSESQPVAQPTIITTTQPPTFNAVPQTKPAVTPTTSEDSIQTSSVDREIIIEKPSESISIIPSVSDTIDNNSRAVEPETNISNNSNHNTKVFYIGVFSILGILVLLVGLYVTTLMKRKSKKNLNDEELAIPRNITLNGIDKTGDVVIPHYSKAKSNDMFYETDPNLNTASSNPNDYSYYSHALYHSQPESQDKTTDNLLNSSHMNQNGVYSGVVDPTKNYNDNYYPSLSSSNVRSSNITNPTIANASVRSPSVRSPSVRSPNMASPSVRSANMRSPIIQSPNMINPKSPNMTNVTSPNMTNVTSPNMTNVTNINSPQSYYGSPPLSYVQSNLANVGTNPFTNGSGVSSVPISQLIDPVYNNWSNTAVHPTNGLSSVGDSTYDIQQTQSLPPTDQDNMDITSLLKHQEKSDILSTAETEDNSSKVNRSLSRVISPRIEYLKSSMIDGNRPERSLVMESTPPSKPVRGKSLNRGAPKTPNRDTSVIASARRSHNESYIYSNEAINESFLASHGNSTILATNPIITEIVDSNVIEEPMITEIETMSSNPTESIQQSIEEASFHQLLSAPVKPPRPVSFPSMNRMSNDFSVQRPLSYQSIGEDGIPRPKRSFSPKVVGKEASPKIIAVKDVSPKVAAIRDGSPRTIGKTNTISEPGTPTSPLRYKKPYVPNIIDSDEE